jgi:hypothetical protein
MLHTGTMLDLPYQTQLDKAGGLTNWQRTNMRGTSGACARMPVLLASGGTLPRHRSTTSSEAHAVPCQSTRCMRDSTTA